MNVEKIYLEKYGSSTGVNSLGWGSEYSQQKRFEIMLEVKGYEYNDKVLDFGCGHGDLSVFVKNYIGFDLRLSSIEIAKKKYPYNEFYVGDASDIKDNYDWVFVSGVFCFYDSWDLNFKNTIFKLFEHCKKGVCFNFLSELTPNGKQKDMKYVKVDEVISIIKDLSIKFTVRHDYLPNDFTVYLYK